MNAYVKLYSNNSYEIYKFLNKFFGNQNFYVSDSKLQEYQINYANPIEIANIVGAYSDNIDSFNITMWICLDTDVLIHVTKNNADDIIRYLFERFPY